MEHLDIKWVQNPANIKITCYAQKNDKNNFWFTIWADNKMRKNFALTASLVEEELSRGIEFINRQSGLCFSIPYENLKKYISELEAEIKD